MTSKLPICPDRIRSIPAQFSWVDQRLVRDHHIECLSHEAAKLYLFLITVADCLGLSYYSDPSVCARLAMDAPTLTRARRQLITSGLAIYKKPLYQVLPLDQPQPAMEPPGETEGRKAFKEMFRKFERGAT
jgi:hypothetical protein